MRIRQTRQSVVLCLVLLVLVASLAFATTPLITVNFTTVDVSDVLQAIGRLTGVSIGITSNVKGTVTLNVTKKPLEDVLDIVTKLVGADWRKISDKAYIVGSPDELQQRFPTAPEVLIHPLQFVRAEDAVKALKLAFPSVNVESSADSNSLVLMGTSRFLLEAERFLRAIDVPMKNRTATSIALRYADVKEAAKTLQDAYPDLKVGTETKLGILILSGPSTQVQSALEMIRGLDQAPPARLYAPKYAEAKQLLSLVSTQFPKVDVKLQPDGMLSLTGAPADVDSALSALSSADTEPPEVVETISNTVKLNYVSASDVKTGLKDGFPNVKVSTITQQGSDAIILTGPKSEVEQVTKLVKELDKPLPQVHIEAELSEVSPKAFKELGMKWEYDQLGVHEEPIPSTTGGGGSTLEYRNGFSFGKFDRSSVGATATIGALVRNGLATLLANPSLVAQHGVESHILIGEKIPYEVTQVVQGSLVRSVETEEIGIKLYITPLMSDDGYITLKTRVEVSSFVEFTPAGYPRVATREAETTVRVKDGEIMVIGGLLREEEIKSFQKVPLLGDIPLLKQLFKYKSTDKTKQDLVIFVTPKILKNGESPLINRLSTSSGLSSSIKSSEE